jgi:hypothetical protein
MFPWKGSAGGCGDGVSITAMREAAERKAEMERAEADKKAYRPVGMLKSYGAPPAHPTRDKS